MIIELKVISGAKRNFFKEEEGLIKVYLSAPAVDGKANKALVEFLAKHFKVRKSAIEIIKGLKSREKMINIAQSRSSATPNIGWTCREKASKCCKTFALCYTRCG